VHSDFSIFGNPMSSFDLDRIRRETFIRQIDFHEEIGSTNTRAIRLATAATPFPTLVLAEQQTAGRGRGSNAWWAGSGALTFSVLLKATDYAIPASRCPLISLTAGLAVAESLASFAPACDVRLKWPNDVFLNGRKACGILVETASSASVLVVGIGVNVNNTLTHAPEELQAIATSLVDATGSPCDQTLVLNSILQSLEKCLNWVKQDASELADAWRNRCYLQGRTVQVQAASLGTATDRVTGVCQGIDDEGALILQTETGIVRCISGVVAKIL
jgi:BirA family biotin operon repressor/biotin-[acetyl-CoA-carboxylase] ligase